MKIYIFIILVFTSMLSSCNFYDKVSPQVESIRLTPTNSVSGEAWEKAAPSVLLDFYLNSNKDKEFYEVVANKHTYVYNYCPEKQLLTIASEFSSGWGDQFKDVTIAKLEELSKAKLTFQKYDSLLTKNRPSQTEIIKTNANTKGLN